MKTYTVITILLVTLLSSFGQNCRSISPQTVGYRIMPKAHTFVGYGNTAAQAVANTGGSGLGKTTFNPPPVQIAPNIWISRKTVLIPTIDPVYSAKSIETFLKYRNTGVILR